MLRWFVCIIYAFIILIFLQPASMVFLNSTIHDEGPEI